MAAHDLRKSLRDAVAKLGPDGVAALMSDKTVLMTFHGAGGEGKPQSVEELIASAAEHGEESEPDMEDGDIEAYLCAALEIGQGN